MYKYSVTSSPHIVSPMTTRRIMLDVVISLCPALLMSVVLFGARAAVVTLFTVACCVALEYAWCKLMKKSSPIGDMSAVVTGILLAFNLPASIPLWQAAVGSLVAVIVVKQLFGGIGCNIVNPALAGRVVMSLSFPASMTTYSFPATAPDALSAATPLALIKNGAAGSFELLPLLLGQRGGMLGCTCVLALVAGGVYLVIKGVIKPHIPLSYILGALVFLFLFGCDDPIKSVLSGGLFLGAIFMATDYTTSPYTNAGKIVFGLGCAVITAGIRCFGNFTEGVSFAILIMNLLVPYINDFTRKVPFGVQATSNK